MTSSTHAGPAPVPDPAAVPAGSIVVGVDGSTSSDHALAWATEQARLEHRALVVVHASHLGYGGDLLWMGQPGVDVDGLLAEMEASSRTLLTQARADALSQAPDLDVHTVLSLLDPRDALLGLAERAALVVVGSRGRGTVATLLLGSVSVAVSKHATCPVVVIRRDADPEPQRGILVGVDGTEDSLPAIELAFELASLRSVPLTALHVYFDASRVSERDTIVDDSETEPADQRALLSESLAGMREKFPDVETHLVLRRGLRDRQLVRASYGEAMLVVGSRRRGLVEDLVRGSVAPTVVEHAVCDVVVVPARAGTTD